MKFPRFLTDLFFPPHCPFCNRTVEREVPAPCPKCESADFWLKPQQVLRTGDHFSRCVSVGWYTGELRQSVLRFKFNDQPEYAKAYAPLLAKTIRAYLPGSYDVITWMPVSAKTLQKRGYDQAGRLAEETAAVLNAPVLPLLEKVRDTEAQSSLEDGSKRWSNVAGVYSVPHPEQVSGKRVLLIDDIITSGATLEEGAKTLLSAGAAQVVAATFCRTPPHKE